MKCPTACLHPFGNVAEQLLRDVQERLVFRANVYFKTDILQFKPSPGDLAYPEKLEMMKVCFEATYCIHFRVIGDINLTKSFKSRVLEYCR